MSIVSSKHIFTNLQGPEYVSFWILATLLSLHVGTSQICVSLGVNKDKGPKESLQSFLTVALSFHGIQGLNKAFSQAIRYRNSSEVNCVPSSLTNCSGKPVRENNVRSSSSVSVGVAFLTGNTSGHFEYASTTTRQIVKKGCCIVDVDLLSGTGGKFPHI